MGSRDQLEPIEKASRDELCALQLDRLKRTLELAYRRVPHYRRAFDAAGVHPSDLDDLSGLAKFPFTAKADLRANYPFGMFAAPMSEIGIARIGMITDRTDPRNRKITTMTINSVSESVVSTSRIASLI